jgi:TRAP transporter 4TM/12TM fusion protein
MNNNVKLKKSFLNLENIYTTASIIYVSMTILYVGTFFTDRPRYGILFFGGSMIIFILRALRKDFKIYKKAADSFMGKLIAITLIFIVIFITYYYWKEFYLLMYERAGFSNLLDKILGGICLVLTIIAVYSFSGLPIVIVGLFFIFYALFGNYFPGILKFSGFTISRLVDITTVELGRGIFGVLLQLAGSLIAIYVIFAGFVFGLGGFNVVIRISFFIARYSKYLVSQSAVFASAVMGMFTGSGTANVAGTGSFTIPLMKRYKVPSYFAGAIEAVASAGGQIMPPIMGAAAFLMAEYLGVPYIKIAAIGVLPAILYFAGVAFSVYHLSQLIKIEIPTDIKTKNVGEVKKTKAEILDLFILGLPLLLSLILLIFLLVVVQIDALLSGYYTTIFLITFTFLQGIWKNLKNIPNYLKQFIGMMIKGAKQSTDTVMEIALILSLIGVIVVILSTSGLASKMSFLLLSMGKGQMVPLLILAAIVSILLGCVVSTVAVYILAMVTVVPALLRVGIDPIVSHFYVFWYAILGLITPPVAGNVIIACRIAGSEFIKTAKEAVKIGIGLFIIPIVMVVHPELLIWSNKTIIIFIMGLIASYAFSLTFYGGYLLKGVSGKFIRLIIGILGLISIVIIFKQVYINYLISLGLLICFIFINFKFKKKEEVK